MSAHQRYAGAKPHDEHTRLGAELELLELPWQLHLSEVHVCQHREVLFQVSHRRELALALLFQLGKPLLHISNNFRRLLGVQYCYGEASLEQYGGTRAAGQRGSWSLGAGHHA